MVTYRDGEAVIYLKALLAERKEGKGRELSDSVKREQSASTNMKEAKAELARLELERERKRTEAELGRYIHINDLKIRIAAVTGGLLEVVSACVASAPATSKPRVQKAGRTAAQAVRQRFAAGYE